MNTAMRKVTRELTLLDGNGIRRKAGMHRVNRRADRKLGEVAAMFQESIPECHAAKEEQFLCRKLLFENCEPMEELYLLYDVENRFTAVSYNLLLQTFVEASEDFAYRFTLKYEGILRMRSAAFVCVADEKKNGEAEKKEGSVEKRQKDILQALNDPIILDKIRKLGLVQADLQYFPAQRRWTAGIKSLQGSSTWIFLPPVMQVIRPGKRELYALAEIMRMMVSTVS